MSERLKEHAWKACVGVTSPWVRIPLSPLIRTPDHVPGIIRSGGLCNRRLRTPPGPEGSNGSGLPDVTQYPPGLALAARGHGPQRPALTNTVSGTA